MRPQFILCILFVFGSFTFVHGQKLFTEDGKASFYSDKFEGKTTASGEKFRQSKMTAAHKHLPFGTKVKVTNKENQKSVVVVINDRGPFVEGRIIDLSKAAAEQIGMIQQGVARVHIEVVEAHDPKTTTYDHDRPSRKDVDVDESVYYRITAEALEPTGFGVQIGSYEESANLLGVVDHLKKAYQKNVTVEVSKVRGVKIYKIILGRYKTRDHADRFRAELDSSYPGCFVVDFSKLN